MRSAAYTVVFMTAGGWIGIKGTSNGLQQLNLPVNTEQAAINALENESSPSDVIPAQIKELKKRLSAYFNGQKIAFPDKLDYAGYTPFQSRVWEAARKIPYGQTRSYGWIAQQIGNPKASRAVGQALGRNPFPIIVPCHRVIAGDGGLGGFSGGLDMKNKLLALEKALT
jgi:methylated-DNA-[protein]-cysteine S-methyltransferase